MAKGIPEVKIEIPGKGAVAVRTVFFDAAGTLFDVGGSVGEIYAGIAAGYGAVVEPETVQEGFIRHFRARPPLAFDPELSESSRLELERHWWRELVGLVFEGREIRCFDLFFDELFDYFRGGRAWHLYDDVIPTLDALKAAGISTGVISNFDSRLVEVLRDLGIHNLFDTVHISSREGSAKPDPAIFRRALEAHSVEPAMAIHVGDNRREDYEGALSAGLNAILIDRSGQTEESCCITRLDRLMSRTAGYAIE